jgi:hypothetical protein
MKRRFSLAAVSPEAENRFKLSKKLFEKALKGRNKIAQGIALGYRHR